VVGPSQEIYEEIRRVREEFHKPVVIHSSGLMASGGYYAAVAGDEIVVEPGVMMGSIGVIMQFMNLEKLYDWAKVTRYSLTTGKFKDSGAEYRAMRDDEKALFQDLLNDVWKQFKDVVAVGRDLDPKFVEQYADGRVMTGQQGVDLGFADELGTLEEAYEIAADLAGLGDDWEVFEAPKHKPSILDALPIGRDDEDEAESITKLSQAVSGLGGLGGLSDKLLKTKLANKPLFLMPGSYE
jgi:protease-4